MEKVLFKGHIVYPDRVSERPEFIAVEGGTITFVGQVKDFGAYGGYIVRDFGSAYICPGFIDLHVHGSGGADVMDGTNEALETISLSLARGGTTSFLAATMSASREDIARTLGCIADTIKNGVAGAGIAGAHLEGPFLHPEKKGAQKEVHLRPPDLDEFRDYAVAARGTLKMITIAPELTGAIDLIKAARSLGLVAAIGHSAASAGQVREACRAGLGHATHLFNAMSGMHHRQPGTAGAALSMEELTVDIIPDGHHVHPDVIKIAVRAKGIDNVCAISDCNRAGQMADGEYDLGGQVVRVSDGIARLDDGTIAGSTVSMSRAVQVLIDAVGLAVQDAVKMASANPARVLGLGTKGRLLPGMDADITVLDRKFAVLMTMAGGRVVYRSE